MFYANVCEVESDLRCGYFSIGGTREKELEKEKEKELEKEKEKQKEKKENEKTLEKRNGKGPSPAHERS